MTPLKTSAFNLPALLFNCSLIKSWLKYVPVLLLVIGLADVQAQTLPDATQDFTGYTKMSDGSNRMISPDGFFILSSSDDANLDADDFGAYLLAGGDGATGYLEVQVNPASELGSFELVELFVGEYDTGGNADFENNTVTAYNGEDIVAEAIPYNSVGDGVVENYPIDYSTFSGKRIDRLRISFTALSGTNFDAYNLVSFTINEADQEPPISAPGVSTSAASNVTATGADLGGNVTSDGGAAVTDRGIVYNTTGTPTTSDTKVQVGSGTGAFSQTVSGLSASTTYYVRSYAINSEGTSYGSEESFVTSAVTGEKFDFESVAATYTGWDTPTLMVEDNDIDPSFTVHATTDNVYKGSENGWAFNGSEGLYFGGANFEEQVDFEIESGNSFDLKGFYISHQGDNDTNPTDYTLSTDKGSITINPPLDGVGELTYIDVAGNANAAYFQDISSFTLEAPGNGAWFEIDDIFLDDFQVTNTAPTDITLNSTTVNQSGGSNAIVGSLSATDADGGDTHSYSLVAGTGDDDNASFNISGSELRANDATALAAGTYSVRVQTDDGTDSFQKVFNISVVDDINDPPLLTATGNGPAFTEGGTAVDLYSGITVSTVESGQTISGMTLTVTNLSDGASEILGIDGSDVALTDGNSVFTATNNLTANVSVTGSTATVSFSGANLTPAQMQTLVDGLAYRNTSDNPTAGSNRVVTITAVSDNGGTANGGDDTSALNLQSTVSLTAVNDAPVAVNASISGTYTYEEELTGSYDYSDPENDAESGTVFQWYRSDDGAGTNRSAITGATNLTYTLAKADIGKFISFEVIPNDGTVSGSAVESDFSGPVASPFAGGEGTEASPWQIATAEHLDYVRDFLDSHFIQTTDIDLGISPWSDGNGWSSIASHNSGKEFTGTYNGDGHLISNLTINNTDEYYMAFMGTIGDGGVIKNLTFDNAHIRGDGRSSVVVISHYGLIENVTVTGSVTARLSAAGFVGWRIYQGTLKNVVSEVTVDGNSVAGIASENRGTIEQARFTGTLTSSGEAGGIAVQNTGTIKQSYVTGKVSGNGGFFDPNDNSRKVGVGGIASAVEYGSIIDSYFDGELHSSSTTDYPAGGIVGTLVVGGIVENTYVSGTVNTESGNSYTGATIGFIMEDMFGGSGGNVESNIWSQATSNQASGIGDGSSSGIFEHTKDKMKTLSTFTDVGWDFDTVWQIDEPGSGNISYPYLQSNSQDPVPGYEINNLPVASNVTISGSLIFDQKLTGVYDYSDDDGDAEGATTYQWYRSDDAAGTNRSAITDSTNSTYTSGKDDIGKYISFEVIPNDGTASGSAVESDFSGPVASPFAGGEGTEANPWQIATAEHLDYVRDFPDNYFQQTADIDLGVSPWNDGDGWEPLGTSGDPFTGTFNGGGNTITGLFIDRDGDHIGLFGFIESDGVISGLGLEEVHISGSQRVGGLTGFNRGHISGSYVTGSVSGTNRIGGLTGLNADGVIEQSYTAGTVHVTENRAGGLAGENTNNGAIVQSYSMAAVSGSNVLVGGLVGENNYSTIERSFATGAVSGGGQLGGLAGQNSSGDSDDISGSFWDTETSGQTSSAGGTGLSTAEMTTYKTFTDAGWDFDAIWQIDEPGSGSISYPYLQSNPQDPAPGYRVVNPPVASDFSTSDGPYQNQVYIFDTADFGYSDEDSDPLVLMRITTAPGNGTLYVDANDNDAFDTGEELADGDAVSKNDLDAGNLQYITSGSDPGSFTFEVFDGILYSASTYTASLNMIGEPVISFVSTGSTGDESVASKTLEIKLSNTFAADVTVDYVISGTAENGSDYTLTDGTLTVPSGDMEGAITIADIADDAVLEMDETVIVTLDNPVQASLGTNNVHTYTITDNDAAAVTLTDAAGNEDDGPITITATLDHAVQGGFTVDVSTANGTADTGDNDYTPLTGLTLTFAGMAGETQTFEVEPTADAIQESDETLTVNLDNLGNTSLPVDISDGAGVTISNDDAAPVFTSSDNITVDENELTVATIAANHPDAGTALSYSITGGVDAALFSIDGTSGELSFKNATDFENPGDGNKDNNYELTVEAYDGTNSVSQNLTITVTNVNEAPVVDAGIADQSANENSAYTFVIPDDAFADVDLNDNLALTVSNLPDGLNFDPSTGTISGTPTDVDLGENTITVTATDESEVSVSTTFVLSVIPEAPAEIVLATPENGDMDVELQPTLAWETDPGADTYEVRVATDQSFANPVAGASGLTNASYTIANSLDMATTYYWQVRGENAGGAGEWSNAYSFITIPEVPGHVVLQSPVDNTSSVDRAVALIWNAADRAASYKVQIAEDETFQQLTTETTVSDTELQLNGDLLDNTTYFWRVRAENSGGVGAWSAGWNFTTAAIAPVLSFPGIAEEGISIAPRLSWVSGYTGSNFQLRLATDESFQNIVIDTLVTTEDVTLKGLENGTAYYWSVRMKTDLNSSPWAETRNFITRLETSEESVDLEIVFGNTGGGGGNGSSGKSLDTYDYRLVGLPGEEPTSVENLFTGEYGNDWKVFEDNGAEEDFLKEFSNNNPLTFNAGAGYWVLSKEPVSIDKNIASVDISENDTYSIPLHPGWNIISNPFARAADWNQIQTFNNLSTLLYGYDRSFFESKTMEPFQAYYVYNDSGAEFILEIPYTSLDKRGSEEENKSKEKEAARKIHLAINHVGEDITSNLSMVYPLDTKRQKEATHYLPPLTLSRFGAAIIEEENTHREKLLRTIGDTYSEETNHYTVEVKSADRSEIRWQPRFEGMDNTTGVLIVDPKSGRSKILADGETYSFMSDAGHKKFNVYTGNLLELEGVKDGLIPQQFSLEQNYPNPFNPTTTIRFGLDVQDHVQLEVFNILGQKVHTLVNENRTAGWHQVSFDARRLASGTYFYRLVIGQNVKTRQMTLIK